MLTDTGKPQDGERSKSLLAFNLTLTSEEGRNRGQRRQSERSERPPSAPAAATRSGPDDPEIGEGSQNMIPNDLDLDDEAQTKLEHIDACLDAMDEEAQRLLDERSELIERYS